VYHALKGNNVTLTGNESLRRRSIKDLVDTLEQQGCNIRYLEKVGYFPVVIERGISNSTEPTWQLNTNESSQFASSLLLGMSSLEPKPSIEIKGLEHSWSYIMLTISVLKEWGISTKIQDSLIVLEGNLSTPLHPKIEIDWGSASFLYLISLFTQKVLIISNTTPNSQQADYACVAQFAALGVKTAFDVVSNQASIYTNTIEYPQRITVAAHNFPDLVPALCSALAFLSIDARIEGIGNLKTKESDRIRSIHTNLAQLGCSLNLIEQDIYELNTKNKSLPVRFDIQTFHDHRIAMAFAPWASVIQHVYIDDANCVEKSFPDFWHVMKMCNFELLSPKSP
jgi:3-phosphoshikimate 1-carboxyvinyltransferase